MGLGWGLGQGPGPGQQAEQPKHSRAHTRNWKSACVCEYPCACVFVRVCGSWLALDSLANS